MQKIETNLLVRRKCQSVINLLDDDSTAHLFVAGPAEPGPSDSWADYTEAAHTGYAAIDVTAEWGAVVEEESGVYTSRTGILTWAPPPGGESVEVLGVAVLAGEELAFVAWLDEAFTLETGGLSLRGRLVYREQAASVLRAELER